MRSNEFTMSNIKNPTTLPSYLHFKDSISILSLPISCSELHGVLCGYLCAGAVTEGETYLRALLNHKRNEAIRHAARILFEVYTISQQQISQFNFEFQLMLPDDEAPLIVRAQAFSEWCEGFTQAMTLSGVSYKHLEDEETRDALLHLTEFAQLDYESLHVDENDEKALVEVSEYARMAILRLHGDLLSHPPKSTRKSKKSAVSSKKIH